MKLSNVIVLLVLFNCCESQANCDNDPDNAYQNANCNFNNDISGWFDGGNMNAAFNNLDYNGSMTSGSASLVSVDLITGFSDQTAVLSQCFDVSTSDTSQRTAGVWFNNSSAVDFDCLSQVQFYEGTTCSLANRGMCSTGFTQFSAGSGWSSVTCDSPILTGDVQSIRINLSCANGDTVHSGPSSVGAPFTVNIDNVFVVPQGQMPVELIQFSID